MSQRFTETQNPFLFLPGDFSGPGVLEFIESDRGLSNAEEGEPLPLQTHPHTHARTRTRIHTPSAAFGSSLFNP